MDHWPVQIYSVSDDHAQELIVGLLSGVADLTVDSARRGGNRFVIVQCAAREQARLVRRMITAIDFEASLVRGGTGPLESVAV